jgi:S-formylglutathione hydrolase FrmB
LKQLFFINLFIIKGLILPEFAHAAHVDTLEIFSATMRKNIKCLIVAPENYRATGQPYPVLYLLHGWSGNFAGWLGDAPQLRQHADNYQMLIVCPDGGYDSWYLDSPVDSTVRYDTYISNEVVGFIDYYYNTRRERSGRAIAGLSMGGHGAITLAIKHSDIFGAAGSMAGGLDLRPFKKNDWDLKGVLGDPLTSWQNWETASAVNLVSRLKGRDLPIMIDCGLGDFFLETNREMHLRLLEARIPHEYTERPGEHNGEYWGNAVDYQVLFFHKFFESNSGF